MSAEDFECDVLGLKVLHVCASPETLALPALLIIEDTWPAAFIVRVTPYIVACCTAAFSALSSPPS